MYFRTIEEKLFLNVKFYLADASCIFLILKLQYFLYCTPTHVITTANCDVYYPENISKELELVLLLHKLLRFSDRKSVV